VMLPRASAALAACLKRLDRLGLAISRQSLVARRISALIVDGTQRKLVRRKDVDELVDHIRGTVLTHLSGMGARCSRDMVVQPQHRRGGALGPHRIGSGLRKDGGCAWRAAA
ncbi:MAG: hypothetical protein WB496_29890, partial [Pseudolabrys sp.]